MIDPSEVPDYDLVPLQVIIRPYPICIMAQEVNEWEEKLCSCNSVCILPRVLVFVMTKRNVMIILFFPQALMLQLYRSHYCLYFCVFPQSRLYLLLNVITKGLQSTF